MQNAAAPILYVENEPDEVFFVTRAFKKAEITQPLRGLQNGEEAQAYLLGQGPYGDRTAHPLPSLILLDLSMPLMDGFEVLKWRATQPSIALIPVVVFTSSRHDRDIVQAYRLGANAYLVKPSSTDELLKLAHALKLFWLTHAELPQAHLASGG